MAPFSDKFDEKNDALVLVVDKYGTVLINMRTKEVFQLQVFESQAGLRIPLLASKQSGVSFDSTDKKKTDQQPKNTETSQATVKLTKAEADDLRKSKVLMGLTSFKERHCR